MSGNHNSGVKRSVCPTDGELIKLGEELVEWCKINKKECLHLKQWWSIEKCLLQKDWDAIRKQPIFLPYYEQARAYISLNYLNGTVNAAIANRFMRLYFPELKIDEDELVVLKAKAGKQQEKESQDELARKLVSAIQDSEAVPRAKKAE